MSVIARTVRTMVATCALVAVAALGQPTSALWAQGQDRADVIITFRGPVGPLDENLVRGLNGRVNHSYQIIPGIAASLPAPALAALANNPRVERIEPDGVFYADDYASELAAAWGVEHIGAGNLHPNITGVNVSIAVIDSGVACNHPDLAGQCDLTRGWDFVNNDNDPYDDNGHGTHVAGTIAATRNGAGVVGVAPGAKIVPLKVLNASGSGSFSNVIAALNWAATRGIQVTNNSYGSGSNPGTAVEAAFAATAAQGMLHIASAGNSGQCNPRRNTVGFPAQYSSVVAIGATTQSDQRPCFSSHGPAVEIAAPGVGILSSVPGGGYASWNGTSMASPHVAGVAALVIAAGVSNTDGNPGVGDEVRAILQATATDLGAPGRDNEFGFGLVNAVAAVGAVVAPSPAFTVAVSTSKSTYAAGESAQVTVTVTNEAGAPVTGLSDSHFTKTLDGGVALLTLSHTGGGVYAGTMALTGLSTSGHTITVRADEGARTGQGSARFSIAATPTGEMSATAITYTGYGGKNSDKHFTVSFGIAAGGAPVTGAQVEVQLLRGGAVVTTASSTTDGGGNVAFSVTNPAPGTYSIVITSVTAAGLSWDGVTPTNSYGQS